MFLRLSDADRARFGVEDWIEFDPSTVTVGEAEALEDVGGDWTVLYEKGMKATRNRLWVALYRAGYTATAEDLVSINLIGLQSRTELPGKPDAEAVNSAPAESPTLPTSATSTRRSPRKRSKPSA